MKTDRLLWGSLLWRWLLGEAVAVILVLLGGGDASARTLAVRVPLAQDLPWIRITSPAPHEWKQLGRAALHLTREESIVLRGRVRPGAELRIDEQDVAVEEDGRFEWGLRLEEGPRMLALTARDEAGVNRRALAVLRDSTAPQLELESPSTEAPIPPGRIVLGGRARDPRTKVVRVDGEVAQLVGDRWWKTVQLGPEGGEWTVTATDQLGNTSSRRFRIEAAPRHAAGRLSIEGLSFLHVNPDTGLEEYLHEQTGIELVLVPGGAFRMGYEVDLPPVSLWLLSPNWFRHDQQWSDMQDQPAHDVELSPYLIARTELTRAQWERLAASDAGTAARTDPDDASTLLPAADLSHEECRRWLDRTRPRLWFPSEAQWKHACRAGSQTEFWTGDELPARWSEVQASRQGPVEVGSLPANPWGLHDVHGNVAEWCEDWFAPYETDFARDPRVLEKPGELPGLRVLRGGYSDEVHSRYAMPSWLRQAEAPRVQRPTIGLRPVMNLPAVEGPEGGTP